MELVLYELKIKTILNSKFYQNLTICSINGAYDQNIIIFINNWYILTFQLS